MSDKELIALAKELKLVKGAKAKKLSVDDALELLADHYDIEIEAEDEEDEDEDEWGEDD